MQLVSTNRFYGCINHVAIAFVPCSCRIIHEPPAQARHKRLERELGWKIDSWLSRLTRITRPASLPILRHRFRAGLYFDWVVCAHYQYQPVINIRFPAQHYAIIPLLRTISVTPPPIFLRGVFSWIWIGTIFLWGEIPMATGTLHEWPEWAWSYLVLFFHFTWKGWRFFSADTSTKAVLYGIRLEQRIPVSHHVFS